tara:strand:+ start:1693 stop:2466 length:774 start_codon:yes stop_codon:yes gene_type:complete
MALTNKTIASTYGDILQVDNSGSGRTANGTVVKDGLGQSTALTLGGDKIKITPSSDSTTAVTIETSGGTDLLVVDTTNSLLKAGTTQSYVNTQVQKFYMGSVDVTAGTHTALVAEYNVSAASLITFGTGTDPATTYSLSSSEAISGSFVHVIWYIPANITIDEIRAIASGDSGNVDFHLFSYDMASGTGSGAGDLSGGTLLAHSGSSLVIEDDRVTTQTLTIDSANVAGNKVVVATVERDSGNTDVSAQLIVKYHYQ